MCLIVVAHHASERYALALAANRDERHDRPSAPAGWWPELPQVLGGRDLVAGGSWLAMSIDGRLAAVTNVAEPDRSARPRSRGHIVQEFVADPASARARLALHAQSFGPFNALLLTDGRLVYTSNRRASARLGTGIHSLSNAVLGADWPKLHRAERGMAAALGAADPVSALLGLLAERADQQAPDAYRQSLFIEGRTYGTRSSTVVLVDYDGAVTFYERRFDANAEPVGESRFDFQIAPAVLGLRARESERP